MTDPVPSGTSERTAVLQAHYAGALPLDLLKEEMDRLTRDMATAERVIKNASTTVDELEATLQTALAVAGNRHQRYAQAPPHVRRQLNQDFFSKLFIALDGSVERAELTEPFAQLLSPDWQTTVGDAQNTPVGHQSGDADTAPADRRRQGRSGQGTYPSRERAGQDV